MTLDGPVRKWLITLTVLAVLAGAGVWAVEHHLSTVRERDRREALATGRAYLAAWNAARYADMGALTADDPDAGSSYQNLATRLKSTSLHVSERAVSSDGKRLSFHVIAQLQGLGPLEWDGELHLTKTSRGERVAFTSGTVFPGLRNGQVLSRSTPVVTRGDIEDRRGLVIRTASADLAANVLGRANSPQTGLERLYDARLTGTSGGIVQVVERGSGQVVRVVKTFPPTRPHPVRTTLDLHLQAAAENALRNVPGRAALVVLDSSTGEIRAVADRPVAGLPAAFRSEAPGSTFKVLVALAALQHGYTPSSPVQCPAQLTKGGKTFTNDESLPTAMTFAQAFARSCNTAFLNVADTFPKGTLRALAPTFGFEREPLLSTGAEGGTVPPPAGTSEAYADVIGQGRVEASPLLMASVAAAVASGQWQRPHFDATTPVAADTVALPARPLPALRQMMSDVVTYGTAATAGLPAGTRGKTGTAQYGTTLPLKSHAWFIGYRGPLAFCVYVETGQSGGRTAAPIAAAFLRAT
ncbi:MAG: penicillin-binding protein transpeptidase [Frankiales bacterium]|nr:penicillin-binding protein transpeptidase [Frankiales bacterium]